MSLKPKKPNKPRGTKNTSWKKVEKDWWEFKDGKYSIQVYGQHYGEWYADLCDKNGNTLGMLSYLVPGSRQRDVVCTGVGRTKSVFIEKVKKIREMLSDEKEINALLTLHERNWEMVLTKCVDGDMTVSEYLRTDDAKGYKYLYVSDFK